MWQSPSFPHTRAVSEARALIADADRAAGIPSSVRAVAWRMASDAYARNRHRRVTGQWWLQ